MKIFTRSLLASALFALSLGAHAQDPKPADSSVVAPVVDTLQALPVDTTFSIDDEIDAEDTTKKAWYARQWALSVKGGTMGIGGEIVKGFGKHFSVRLGYNMFNYAHTLSPVGDAEDSVRAEINLKVQNATLIADWFFWRGCHLSAGLVMNLSKLETSMYLDKKFKVGAIDVSPEKVGHATIIIANPKYTPYIGIGFGRPISYDHRFSMNVDLGMLYTGGIKVEKFGATGLLEPTGGEENRAQFEKNLKWAYAYPVITLQMSYKFFK